MILQPPHANAPPPPRIPPPSMPNLDQFRLKDQVCVACGHAPAMQQPEPRRHGATTMRARRCKQAARRTRAPAARLTWDGGRCTGFAVAQRRRDLRVTPSACDGPAGCATSAWPHARCGQPLPSTTASRPRCKQAGGGEQHVSQRGASALRCRQQQQPALTTCRGCPGPTCRQQHGSAQWLAAGTAAVARQHPGPTHPLITLPWPSVKSMGVPRVKLQQGARRASCLPVRAAAAPPLQRRAFACNASTEPHAPVVKLRPIHQLALRARRGAAVRGEAWCTRAHAARAHAPCLSPRSAHARGPPLWPCARTTPAGA